MTSGSRRDRTALALSIALHVCAFALLAFVPPVTIPPAPPEEQIVIARMLRVEHHAGARAAPARAAHAAPAQRRPVELHVTVAHARHAQVVADEQRYRAQPTKLAPQEPNRTNAAAPVSAEQATPLPTASAEATPAAVAAAAGAAPSASPAASTAGGGGAGVGNFAETYNASVAPDVRSALLAGVGSGVVIRVEVDENGHATAIVFVRGADDPALRARLLDAQYTPAECNGLPCPGTFELKT
jgi:hypothetical protein